MTLDGKVAAVTGGAGGMGRAFALRLAHAGADVAILDIDLNVAARYGEQLSAASVPDEIRALGRSSIGVEADLSDPDGATGAIEQVVAKLGRIDILVNCAGGAISPVERSAASMTPPEDVDLLFRANFLTMINCCRAAIPHMKGSGGAIVNLATMGVDVTPPSGRHAMYSSVKAAVLRYTQSLAVELGPEGIRVNCVSPGLIETARIKASAAARGLGTSKQAEANPLRRLGTPEDVAGVVEFLVSDAAGYVTGENIRVTGGSTLLSGTG